MTGTDVDSGAPPAAALIARRRAGRRWLVVLAAVLVAAVGVGTWWLYSAHALNDHFGDRETLPRPVGATVYFPVGMSPDGEPAVTLTLHSVDPRITRNSAAATVTVLLCRRSESTLPMMSDDLSFCTNTRPFGQTRLTIRSGDHAGATTVVLAVRTRRPGRVEIDGVHVTYWQGVRYGRQDVGMDMVAEANRPSPQK